MNMHLSLIMLINAAELLIVDSLLCIRLPKKQKFWLRTAICFLAAVIYALMPLELISYFAIHIPVVLISFAFVLISYELSLREAIFISVAGYTVQHISSLLNSIVTYFFPDVFSHFALSGGAQPAFYALIVIIDIIVFGLAYLIFSRRFGVAELRSNATLPVTALGLSVLIMNQLWAVGVYVYGEVDNDSIYTLMEFIWNLLACVLSLVIEFNIFNISRKDTELEATKKIIAEKERQYRMSKSTVEAINRKCHDLKYQLSALKTGTDSQKHIEEAMELVDSFDSQIHTGNDTLDIIFTEKNYYCKKHDITFVCMIDGEKLGFMDVADQYVMFGNIIDNAINAVRQVEDHAKRSIYVNIRAEKKLLLIQTENPFVGELSFRDGLPRTTSGDEFNHGFGMGSIRLIAEKYKGSVNTRAEDGIFYLNIVIPLGE